MESEKNALKEKYDEIMRYYRENEIQLAGESVKELMEMAQEAGNHYYYSVGLNFLGVLQGAVGNLSGAVDYYVDTMVYGEENQVSEILPLAYNNIGSRYLDIGNYETALFYLRKSEEQADQIPVSEYLDAKVKNQRKIVNSLNIALAYTNLEEYGKSNTYLDTAEELMGEKQMQDLEFACEFLRCQNQYYLQNQQYVKEHLPHLLDGIEELVSVYSYEQNISEMFAFLMKLRDREKMQRLLEMVERFVQKRPEIYYQLMAAKMRMEYEHNFGTEQQYEKSCVRMAELYLETERETQKERQQNLDLRMEMRRVEAERNTARQQYEEEEKRQKTLLEEALEDAKRANRAKTEFLSTMSHEIRTPLNAVIGYIDMAQNNLRDPEKLENYHSKSKVAANHLLSIINDVLDVSAIASGHFKVERQPFYLKQLVSEVNTIFRQQASDKNIGFQIELKEVWEEHFVGDRMRVKQIILNLLSNAIKFTPEQGKIALCIQQISGEEIPGEAYVDTEIKRTWMQFKVQDTGIGMSEEFMERMFTPFEQQDASTSRKYGGTGLGLSISKQLTEMMGGRISVWSREQEGTIFTVQIPFETIPEVQVKDEAGRDKKRALIVNGDHKAAAETRKMMKEYGIKADLADSKAKALRQIKLRQGSEYGYDLCLVEENLEDGTGMELVREIREQYGTKLTVLEGPLFRSDLRNFLTGVEQEEEEREESYDQVDLSGLRVILAEDNEMNMEIAEDILKRAGLLIDKAENGQRALELFKASVPGTYQIILMDIQMPLMDGYEAARAIRSLDRLDARSIPIIALTANAFTEDVHRALEAGMNGHIAKPIHIQALYKLMGKLANRHMGD